MIDISSRKAWDSSSSGPSKPGSFKYNSVSRIEPEPSDPSAVIRGDNGCCYEMVKSSGLGVCLIRVRDPDGLTLGFFEKNGIELLGDGDSRLDGSDPFTKIPGDIWSAFVSLAFHYCPDDPKDWVGGHWLGKGSSGSRAKTLEVSIVFLRHEDDLSRWKAVVPKQEVSHASVDADFSESCDLITGEVYDVFPPVGWVHAGSAHSHNTMGAWFSGTDDDYELGVPGVHIVLGNIDKKEGTYEAKGSVVVREVRKAVEFLDLVDTTATEPTTFHADCLKLVKEEKPKIITYAGSSSTYRPGRTWDQASKKWVDKPGPAQGRSSDKLQTWDPINRIWVDSDIDSDSDETARLPLIDDSDDVLGFRSESQSMEEARAEYAALTDQGADPLHDPYWDWDIPEDSEHDVTVDPMAEREAIEEAMAQADPEDVQLVCQTFLDDDDVEDIGDDEFDVTRMGF